MSGTTSTITSKWQVTIPEQVRRELPFKIGQRIVWQVEGDRLVGRRIRSISDLAGSLKSDVSPVEDQEINALAEAALARHDRLIRKRS